MNAGWPVNGAETLGEAPVAPSARRTIPFEYSFQFSLEGRPNVVHNSTVTVSVEAAFTAVSIGYGVVADVPPLRFGFLPRPVAEAARSGAPAAPAITALTRFLDRPLWQEVTTLGAALPGLPRLRVPTGLGGLGAALAPSAVTGSAFANGAVTSGSTAVVPPNTLNELQARVQEVGPELFTTAVVSAAAERLGEQDELAAGRLGPRTADLLQNGIRINPLFFDEIARALSSGGRLDPRILEEALEAVAAPPERILFKYALFDDGTGREFQSEPVLNLAGLGAADGRRPFRYFARPIEFERRTAVRMQVIEVSSFKGQLHVTLQGFKTLGSPGTPTGPRPTTRHPRRRR